MYTDFYYLLYIILDRAQARTDENDKTKLKFANINLNLREHRSWMEKVLDTFWPQFSFVIAHLPLYFLTSLLLHHCTFTITIEVYINFNSVQVVRLHLLLTVKESAINVPMNLDARRRITFFANSLFMNMPNAPKVRNMLSFRSDI